MRRNTLKILFSSVVCMTLAAGCSSEYEPSNDSGSGGASAKSADIPESAITADNRESGVEVAEDDSFNGVLINENGRLVPTAYDQIKTFENGKTPLKEVYVGLDGDDLDGDGSESAPYKTFAKAVSVAEPGTSILIKPGTYDTLFEANDLHATEENPIWIGGIPGQPMPLLAGKKGAVHIARGSYIIIHDIEVAGAEIHGVHVNDGGDLDNPESAHHFVFRNIYNHDIGDSCFKFAGLNYSWLFDCDVSRSHLGGRNSAAIDHVGCHYNTIAYNYIHDAMGISVGFKGGSYESDIFGNLIVNSGENAVNMGQSTGAAFFRPPLEKNYTMYEARDIRTYSNIFIGGQTSFAFISSTNCYAVNNTVILPKSFLFRVLNNDQADALKLAHSGSPHDNTVSNNIFYYDNSLRDPLNVGGGTEPKTFTMQNNVFYYINNPGGTPRNYESQFSAENTIFLDPLFEDAEKNNFALKPDSPASAAGADVPFDITDYRGKPFKNPRSVGAIQY